LVLSNGIFQKISCLKKIPLESVIPGDDFLKEEGFLKILKLLSLDLNKRVVIFGNSSLVFACGFLLLNGPLFYDKNELTKSPFLEKRVKKCMRCCEVCSKRATEKPFETEGNDVKNSKKSNYTEFNKKKKIAEEKKIQECDCSCVCFGDFKAAGFSSWKKSNVIMPFFKDQEVVLLINEKKSELGKNLKGSALKLFKEVFFPNTYILLCFFHLLCYFFDSFFFFYSFFFFHSSFYFSFFFYDNFFNRSMKK